MVTEIRSNLYDQSKLVIVDGKIIGSFKYGIKTHLIATSRVSEVIHKSFESEMDAIVWILRESKLFTKKG